MGTHAAVEIIPLKDLKAANARITLSSDWDVSDLNPFIGLENAVSLEEAVTINAAYVMRQETRVGTIEVGKEAALIVLDRNIFQKPANQISDTKVNLTYLKDRLVYER